MCVVFGLFVFFSSRRRHTRLQGDWSSDVCSSDLGRPGKEDSWLLMPNSLSGRSPDRKSTRLNSSHLVISYAVFCLKKNIPRQPSRALVMIVSRGVSSCCVDALC